MSTSETKAQQTYFENRQIDSAYYGKFVIPRYMKDVLPADRSSSILDIGCGFGQMLGSLRDAGYTSLFGVDITQSAVDHCRSAGLNVQKIDNLIEYAKQSREKFSLIIMSHVLEHIDKDKIIPTLQNIRQHILSPGGSYIVMVPNAQSDTGCYWAYEDFTHTTMFTSGSLFYVLKAAGFQNITFLDVHGASGRNIFRKFAGELLLILYRTNKRFWHAVTGNSFHRQSPEIFTWEIKAIAQ